MLNQMPDLLLTNTLHYMSHKVSVFMICCVLALSCAGTETAGRNYFPLTDRAQWNYSGRLTSPTGAQFSFRSTIRIDGHILIHNKQYFKLVVTSDLYRLTGAAKPTEHVRYYRVAPDGIYVSPGTDIDPPELLEMPLPIPIGGKWLSGPTEVQAERAGTISVGGHVYVNCLKLTYRGADGAQTIENYLAPDVGLIKAVSVDSTGPKATTELTLEKYIL
jgi:hypothetical protein